jgi:hypothetical protein
VTLSSARTRAYLCGALTGAFAALAVVAGRRRRRVAVLWALCSLGCGALAVGYEERAQTTAAVDTERTA